MYKFRKKIFYTFASLVPLIFGITLPIFVKNENVSFKTSLNNNVESRTSSYPSEVSINPANVGTFDYGNEFANNYSAYISLGQLLNRGGGYYSNFYIGLDPNDNIVKTRLNLDTNSLVRRFSQDFRNSSPVVDDDWYERFQKDSTIIVDDHCSAFVKRFKVNGKLHDYMQSTGMWKYGTDGSVQFVNYVYTDENGNKQNYDVRNKNGQTNITYFKDIAKISPNTPYATIGLKSFDDKDSNGKLYIGKNFGWIHQDRSSIISNSPGLYNKVVKNSSKADATMAAVLTYAYSSINNQIDVYSTKGEQTDLNQTNISSSWTLSENELNYTPSYFINRFRDKIERSITIRMVDGFPGCHDGNSELKLIANDTNGTVSVQFKPGSILKRGGVYDNSQVRTLELFSGFKKESTFVKSPLYVSSSSLISSLSPFELANELGKVDQDSTIYDELINLIYKNCEVIFDNWYVDSDVTIPNERLSLKNGNYEFVSSTSTSITFKISVNDILLNGEPESGWHQFTITLDGLANKDTKVLDSVKNNGIPGNGLNLKISDFSDTLDATKENILKNWIVSNFKNIFGGYIVDPITVDQITIVKNYVNSDMKNTVNISIKYQNSMIDSKINPEHIFDFNITNLHNDIFTINKKNVELTDNDLNSNLSTIKPSEYNDDEELKKVITNKIQQDTSSTIPPQTKSTQKSNSTYAATTSAPMNGEFVVQENRGIITKNLPSTYYAKSYNPKTVSVGEKYLLLPTNNDGIVFVDKNSGQLANIQPNSERWESGSSTCSGKLGSITSNRDILAVEYSVNFKAFLVVSKAGSSTGSSYVVSVVFEETGNIFSNMFSGSKTLSDLEYQTFMIVPIVNTSNCYIVVPGFYTNKDIRPSFTTKIWLQNNDFIKYSDDYNLYNKYNDNAYHALSSMVATWNDTDRDVYVLNTIFASGKAWNQFFVNGEYKTEYSGYRVSQEGYTDGDPLNKYVASNNVSGGYIFKENQSYKYAFIATAGDYKRDGRIISGTFNNTINDNNAASSVNIISLQSTIDWDIVSGKIYQDMSSMKAFALLNCGYVNSGSNRSTERIIRFKLDGGWSNGALDAGQIKSSADNAINGKDETISMFYTYPNTTDFNNQPPILIPDYTNDYYSNLYFIKINEKNIYAIDENSPNSSSEEPDKIWAYWTEINNVNYLLDDVSSFRPEEWLESMSISGKTHEEIIIERLNSEGDKFFSKIRGSYNSQVDKIKYKISDSTIQINQIRLTNVYDKGIFYESKIYGSDKPIITLYGFKNYRDTDYFLNLPFYDDINQVVEIINKTPDDKKGLLYVDYRLPSFYVESEYIDSNNPNYENWAFTYRATISGFKTESANNISLNKELNGGNASINEYVSNKTLTNAYDYRTKIKERLIEDVNASTLNNKDEILNYINGNNFLNDSTFTDPSMLNDTTAQIIFKNNMLFQLTNNIEFEQGVNYTINNISFNETTINSIGINETISLDEFNTKTLLEKIDILGLELNNTSPKLYTDDRFNMFKDDSLKIQATGNNESGNALIEVWFAECYINNTIETNYTYQFNFKFKTTIITDSVDYLKETVDVNLINQSWTGNIIDVYNLISGNGTTFDWNSIKQVLFNSNINKDDYDLKYVSISYNTTSTNNSLDLVLSIINKANPQSVVNEVVNLTSFSEELIITPTNPQIVPSVPNELNFNSSDNDYLINANKVLSFNPGKSPIDNTDISIKKATKGVFQENVDGMNVVFVNYQFNGVYLSDKLNSFTQNYVVKVKFEYDIATKKLFSMKIVDNEIIDNPVTNASKNYNNYWWIYLLVLLVVIMFVILLFITIHCYKNRGKYEN